MLQSFVAPVIILAASLWTATTVVPSCTWTSVLAINFF